MTHRKTMITVGWKFAVIDAALVEELAPLLTLHSRSFTTGRAGVNTSVTAEPLFGIRDGKLYVPAGLVERICTYLRARGIDVTVKHGREWMTPEQADLMLPDDPELRREERLLARTFLQAPRGQLLISSRGEMVRWLGLLMTVLAGLRILVIVKTREAASRLAEELRRVTSRPVTDDPELSYRSVACVFITTEHFFTRIGITIWDVIAYTAPELALAKDPCPMHHRFFNVARYVFRSPQDTLTADEELLLEVLCGPVVYRSAELPRSPNVTVIDVGCTGHSISLKRRTSQTALQRKQRMWQDAGRNTELADLARICATGNLQDLVETGVVPRHAVPSALLHTPKPLVAILVESPEHARALQVQLPYWGLRCGPHALPNTAFGSDQEIVTFVAAESWGLGGDILIRADTAPGWPLTAVPMGAAMTPGLLLDVGMPGQTPEFQAGRHAAYQQRGWTIAARLPGPVTGALHR